MHSHLLSNTLVKIKNASLATKKNVRVALSNINISIVKILRDEKYIRGFAIQKADRHFTILIRLKYSLNISVVRNIRQLSKSGSRSYKSLRNLQLSSESIGMTIITTPKGLMTGKTAVKLGVGGEVICSVS